MYRIVLWVWSSWLLVGCASSEGKKEDAVQLPYYNEPTFTPLFDIAQEKVTHRVSGFAFLDEDSTLVDERIIEGKVHVANFMFTSCGSICPKMTNNMKIVSDSLGSREDLVFLSYSVTPWLDRPNVLKKYKAEKKIENENWHFLTGSKSDIYSLARKSYFAEEDIGFSKDSTEFLHTEHFILVDKTRRIRGIYNGTLALEMRLLMDDIGTLLQE